MSELEKFVVSKEKVLINYAGGPRWAGLDSKITYEALAEVGDMNGKTVLDAGCCRGDLIPFLTPSCLYLGVDINKLTIERAKETYPDHDFSLEDVMEMEKKFDFVLASSLLGWTYYKHTEMVEKLWDMALDTLAFTCKSVGLEEMTEFCKTLTDNFTVKKEFSSQEDLFILRRELAP